MQRPHPTRVEHKALLPHLEHILALADATAEGVDHRLVERVQGTYGFLRDDLLHHARVEEQALYPVVARVMGATEATATMSRDHSRWQAPPRIHPPARRQSRRWTGSPGRPGSTRRRRSVP